MAIPLGSNANHSRRTLSTSSAVVVAVVGTILQVDDEELLSKFILRAVSVRHGKAAAGAWGTGAEFT